MEVACPFRIVLKNLRPRDRAMVHGYCEELGLSHDTVGRGGGGDDTASLSIGRRDSEEEPTAEEVCLWATLQSDGCHSFSFPADVSLSRRSCPRRRLPKL